MSDGGNRVAYAVGGLVLGGLLVYGVLTATQSDDDDRPPIIVKGGSLIFESGVDERPGKPWKAAQGTNQWQQDHPNGKPTKLFQLYFVGGTGDCYPVTARDFTVSFDDDGVENTPPKPYTVNIRQGGGKPVPTVSGENLQIDSADSKRLYTGTANTGKLLSVSGSNFTCNAPERVYVESVK